MYRSQLGNKSFDHVVDYADDFLKYLDRYRIDNLVASDYDSVICGFLHSVYNVEILGKLPNSDAALGIIDNKDIGQFTTLLAQINSASIASGKHPLLSHVLLADFIPIISDLCKVINSQVTQAGGDYSGIEILVQETFFELYTSNHLLYRNKTGLAFIGYGEKEIYPTIHRIEVHDCILNKLVLNDIETVSVSNSITASIRPMAQTDVMMTYITGINPMFEKLIKELTFNTVNNVLDTIKTLAAKDPTLASAIGAVDLTPFMKQYSKDIDDIKLRDAISPLMNTVASMEKEDLAELAENLIYLTSLKRRITSDKESVGGPVDVAIISKGDGFIWLKRKHYFNPELNRCFFEKYYE